MKEQFTQPPLSIARRRLHRWQRIGLVAGPGIPLALIASLVAHSGASGQDRSTSSVAQPLSFTDTQGVLHRLTPLVVDTEAATAWPDEGSHLISTDWSAPEPVLQEPVPSDLDVAQVSSSPTTRFPGAVTIVALPPPIKPAAAPSPPSPKVEVIAVPQQVRAAALAAMIRAEQDVTTGRFAARGGEHAQGRQHKQHGERDR